MERFVIIVAGGKGERMQCDEPKQFLLLAGKPILMHTIEAFSNSHLGFKIILVLPSQWVEYWQELCSVHNFKIPVNIVKGGVSRFHSVKNGLDTITSTEAVVAIHDGVRPFVSKDLIERLIQHAQEHGNAIPAISIHDSLRIIDNETNRPINRSAIKSIQTPQCFQISLIKEAMSQIYKPDFTDDASVLEAMGEKIHLLEGDLKNIKITTHVDRQIAEILIKQ